MRVLGVDLAGSPARATGLCRLYDNFVETCIAFKDDEIISVAEKFNASIVSIDAPLALPLNKSLDDRMCFRECDLILRKMGIKFFPINFAGMRSLTLRGISLKKRLEEMGFYVVETYPGAAFQILGLPRPKSAESRKIIREFYIEKCGLRGVKENPSAHELDAIMCALVGYWHLSGRSMAIGNPQEILMILPDAQKLNF